MNKPLESSDSWLVKDTHKWIPSVPAAQPSCRKIQACVIHHCCTQSECSLSCWICCMLRIYRRPWGLFVMNTDSIELHTLKSNKSVNN
jgi:hypothetical protein